MRPFANDQKNYVLVTTQTSVLIVLDIKTIQSGVECGVWQFKRFHACKAYLYHLSTKSITTNKPDLLPKTNVFFKFVRSLFGRGIGGMETSGFALLFGVGRHIVVFVFFPLLDAQFCFLVFVGRRNCFLGLFAPLDAQIICCVSSSLDSQIAFSAFW